MGVREDHGWHDDRPCPVWCVTGGDHLTMRLRTGGDFWHSGAVTHVRTADVDHNYDEIHVRVRLSQHEQVDERGHIRHPVQVLIDGGWGFDVTDARKLAVVLIQAADKAEKQSHDLPDR